MSNLPLLIVYCLLIVAASLIGGKLPTWVKLDHKRMQILISFVGGLMLGIALFHMLPHAFAHLGSGQNGTLIIGVSQIDQLVMSMMLGLVVMFFLLRTFHFHHHDPEQLPAAHEHECEHDHDHHHHHTHGPVDSLAKDMSWMGVFVGLSLHTLIDGFALGASIQADAMHGSPSFLLGIGTFVAILLHKPLDALSITSLMRAANWSGSAQILVNGTFALMCPIGAFLFLIGTTFLVEQQSLIVGSMLAFAAGVFLCISLSDLLPEMEFHSHHRIPLSIALLVGIALAWSIRFLEPSHAPVPQSQNEVMFKLPTESE